MLYMYKKNAIVKYKQKIIVKIKDFLFINNELLLNFWIKTIKIVNYF